MNESNKAISEFPLMSLFLRCYSSSLSSFSFPTESQIRHLCKSGALSDAFRALNSIDPKEISVKSTLYASLLQTCVKTASFEPGLQIHAHVLKSGIDTDRFVGNSLLALYFKLGFNVSQTRRVFDNLVFKDAISWTSMVVGYVKAGKSSDGVLLFRDMMGFGVDPNGFTLSAVIKGCSELLDLKLGRCFHGVVVKLGFGLNDVIASSLIDMYGRNCAAEDACLVFDEIPEPDLVCWTSVVSALTRSDSFKLALGMFRSMQKWVVSFSDSFTFGTVLAACGNLGWLKQGKEVHSKVTIGGLCGNVIVESSLVDMYGKCGSVEAARRVFDRMMERNTVSWSAMLGVYCQNGRFESVFDLFRVMEKDDLYSFGTVLRACAGLAAVRLGKEVHGQYVRKGSLRDVVVESALVDLYAKCGCVEFAHRVFIRMPVRNLITWNSMISGLAQNGRGVEALGLLDEMIKERIEPDYITFVGVLFACSHSGLVEQGRKCFNLMTTVYGIKAGIEHYNCMVDLLGRAGLLEEAENLIENADGMDNSSLWAALLGACTGCADSTIAERVAKRVMELKPECHLSYVLLANVYRAVGRWNDALKIRKLMKDRGVRKMPGKSWIESFGGLNGHKPTIYFPVTGHNGC